MKRAILSLIFASFILYVRYIALPDLLVQFPLSPDLLLLIALPLLLLPLLGMRTRDAGLSLGEAGRNMKFATLGLAASIPLLFLAAQLPDFYNYYPLFGWARAGIPNLIAYELLILLFMFATEFFFRGFLMMGMRGLGGPAAIFLQNIPYTLAHFGKPPLEIPGSFVAGLFFGWVDYRANSIIPSTILHWSINVVFDAFCIYFFFSR